MGNVLDQEDGDLADAENLDHEDVIVQIALPVLLLNRLNVDPDVARGALVRGSVGYEDIKPPLVVVMDLCAEQGRVEFAEANKEQKREPDAQVLAALLLLLADSEFDCWLLLACLQDEHERDSDAVEQKSTLEQLHNADLDFNRQVLHVHVVLPLYVIVIMVTASAGCIVMLVCDILDL